MSRQHVSQSLPADPDGAQGEAQVTASPADLITQGAICQKLGISDDTWRRWRKAGLTPQAVDLPGHPRWRREDIDRFTAPTLRWPQPRFFASPRRHALKVATSTAAQKPKTVGGKSIGGSR